MTKDETEELLGRKLRLTGSDEYSARGESNMKKIVLGIVILGLYDRGGRLWRRGADESGASRGAGGPDATGGASGK